jgi:hypothetical protein
MTGSSSLRELEYSALMARIREHARTSTLCWTAAGLAAAFLFSSAVSAHQPALLLPVQFCVVFGYHAVLHARRDTRLVEGYVQEFFEKERDGAQWHSRAAHLDSLPGSPSRQEWMSAALANGVMLLTVVFSWWYAEGATRGDLMASLVTMIGAGFAVHSLSETLKLDRPGTAPGWSQLSGRLREVTPPIKRVTSV